MVKGVSSLVFTAAQGPENPRLLAGRLGEFPSNHKQCVIMAHLALPPTESSHRNKDFLTVVQGLPRGLETFSKEVGKWKTLFSPPRTPMPQITIISEAFTAKDGPLLLYSFHMASPPGWGVESLLGRSSQRAIKTSQGLTHVLLHFAI